MAELDGLRGIAILLVMIHRMYPRAGGATPWPIEAGWIGVDLFFVISGFLIAGILLDTRDDPDFFRNFYARRVLRIFPLFYLLVGGMLVVFPLAHHGEFLRQAGSPAWYLLQLGNVPESLLGRDPPYWLAPVWSLAIEEQFYLTFPMLVRWSDPGKLGRRLAAIAGLALVLRIVTTAVIPDHERVQYLFTLCRLDTIAIGCLLAVAVRSRPYAMWRPVLPRLLVPVIAAATAIALVTQLDRTTWFGRTLGYDVVALGFAALVLLVLERRDHRATAVLRNPALRYLGKLCFGLYLLHRPADTLVSAIAAHTPLDGDSLAWLPIKIAAAVGLATLSWRLIEQPFLRLKRRFRSHAHPIARGPAVIAAAAAAALSLLACHGAPSPTAQLATVDAVGPSDAGTEATTDATTYATADARTIAADAMVPDAPPDSPPPVLGRVLYPEGALHSPISADLAAQLGQLAAQAPATENVFAKIGDSMTASASFLTCADTCALGAYGELAATRGYFEAGNAAGTTPYDRISLAATGGWTTADVLIAAIVGALAPLDLETAALQPRYGVVMLGTNDVRYGRTVDAFGADLWSIIDRLRARGTLPIMSTIPSMHGDPDSNARIPTFNRVIRAIAQGRGLPLIDFHQALAGLPNEGIGSDGIHPTTAPDGACTLTSAGLQYGYDTRNLLTLEALDRTRRARNGAAFDPSVTRRTGSGTHSDPFRGQLPIADLADTRTGELGFTSYPCGVTASGHEIVYRIDLPAATAIDAYVVDRDPVNVDIAILAGSLAAASCVAGGDQTASATVGPGPVFIVVDSRDVTTEGEFLLVVEPH
ncbi:MAG TPA: acyltransferase family protein [Kofleriaceae bacterium]|nr:acyltransferase family protein [Kofleriaceae bacterium]